MSASTMPGKNGGTLKVGNPGNKGGGRYPSHVKQLSREAYVECLPILREIAQSFKVPPKCEDCGGPREPPAKVSEVIRAIDVMGKHGLSSVQNVPVLALGHELAKVLDAWCKENGWEVTREQGEVLRDRWLHTLNELRYLDPA